MSEGQKNLYLLLDSRNTPLANAVLLTLPHIPECRFRVLDDKVSVVMEHESVRMVPMDKASPVLLGRILGCRGDEIRMEKLQRLDSELRQNLRMPTHFQSFIYPIMPGVTSNWRGRRAIEANDLSCGGIAFFCDRELKKGERVEVVIPITTAPLVLRCKVLRKRPSNRSESLYAAEFVDMCNDEEKLVREAVFSIQVRGRPRAATSERDDN
ncbi:MAG: PilZ domain-containing protein [Lawsonibacter sp.]|nr:PilZ domain-containing protein [Lawsonibacter sp.]